MKVALDAMGGDRAPAVNIGGAIAALRLYPKLEHLFLVGDEDILKEECAKQGLNLNDKRVSIVHAPEVIGMSEPGAKTVRRKKQSSISIAMDMVKDGRADAFVSAGNTGAAVAAATLKLRTLKGIDRAGIASAIPNEHGLCNILDAGANPEAKPEHLVAYAIMGTAFARHVLGVKNPRVGLMSNGEEDEKGTTFTKETFKRLRATPGINFIGNVEGHDLFDSELDVVLCDGFVGNIVLKSVEATAKAVSKWLKAELKGNPLRLCGAALASGAFKALKEKSSYETYGGSPLLGVNGVVIIAHGSSSALAIQNAIRVAVETVEHGVNPRIEEALAALHESPAAEVIEA
ncbi:phosphate acyltransferase PlsX [Luteolibacter pohnpeiensis]|uniref:Phosphate acyltransferase n=1 Tax=Luteolibacter pohnpeiensis TaxID=454153 RepID=A0A934S229_9BACT|nr:phosphate acyltransferase PlsX [Luteolibacter pohnpeiensis]MBK1880976.1 phosphate acyltransferase PlsX [Luteolibacter pohnpeiensis]